MRRYGCGWLAFVATWLMIVGQCTRAQVRQSDPSAEASGIEAIECNEDGRAGAAPSPIQHPDLLKSYVRRSPCKVAGVDYAVGPGYAPFKDPAAATMAGVEIDGATRTLVVKGDDTVLDGYDFSLHSGYQLVILGSRVVIRNSKFRIGTNTGQYQISIRQAESPIIEYCEFDGHDLGSVLSLIASSHRGLLTLQYNWFHEYPSSPLNLVQDNGSPKFQLRYRFNLLEQGGVSPGAHMNFLQFGGGIASSVEVEFNTSYQTPQIAGGEGFQFYNNTPGGAIASATMAYNTMIASGGKRGSAMSYMVHPGSRFGGDNGAIHHNFFDLRAAWGAFYSKDMGPGWSLSENINMVTGRLITRYNGETVQR